MMIECARTDCDQKGIASCSVCMSEFYCGAECQKKDWKTHKKVCIYMKAVHHAKQLNKGEIKMLKVFDALDSLAQYYAALDQMTKAKTALEEKYNYAVEAYHPEHPLVLQAAERLIQVLIMTENYYDVERFARVCYDGLTRPPSDPESREAAKAAANLALVSYDLNIANGPNKLILMKQRC
jgi:hypothetical protein